MDKAIRNSVLTAQKTEITEYHIYMKLASKCKDKNNADVLRKIAGQELMHAQYWQTKTGIEIKPDKFRVNRTVWLALFLGLTFVLKLMEKKEGTGSRLYRELASAFPEAEKMANDERSHESSILAMLDEERLSYIGSIVLGLNDALVELTGALAGFTLALGDTRLISLAGLITGISASMSMAASDYLSSRAEGDPKAKKSALYTGISYIITVGLLILPFLLLSSKFIALGITLATAILIIFAFNYYISITNDLNFKHRFLEMAIISMGVAAFSFLIGYLLKGALGVES